MGVETAHKETQVEIVWARPTLACSTWHYRAPSTDILRTVMEKVAGFRRDSLVACPKRFHGIFSKTELMAWE